MSTSSPAPEPPVVPSVNSVHLVGRVSAAPELRTLPSGDEIVSIRLVVPRDERSRRRSRQTVDTVECVAWRAALRRTLLRLEGGEHVEVTGSLRRRFTRATGSPTSWVSVELESCRRAPGRDT